MEKPQFIPAHQASQHVIVLPLEEEAWLDANHEIDVEVDEQAELSPETEQKDETAIVLARPADAVEPPPAVVSALPVRREVTSPPHEIIQFDHSHGGELTLGGMPTLPFLARPRRWPVAVLVAILFIVVANIGFTIYSMWQSRRSVDELKTALTGHRDEQMEMLIHEIRKEVRSRALADTLQLRTELGAILDEQSRKQSEQVERRLRSTAERPAAEASQAASRSRGTRSADKRQEGQSRSAPQATLAAATEEPAEAKPVDPNAPADVIFLIDASTLPDRAMALVMSELRRAIDQVNKRKRWTILVFCDRQIIEIPQQIASVSEASESEPVSSIASAVTDSDVPPKPCANLGDALRHALSTDPYDLYLFAADVGRGGGNRALSPLTVLRQVNEDRATRVHSIQFFARDADDMLLKIARENGGTYTLVTAPTVN